MVSWSRDWVATSVGLMYRHIIAITTLNIFIQHTVVECHTNHSSFFILILYFILPAHPRHHPLTLPPDIGVRQTSTHFGTPIPIIVTSDVVHICSGHSARLSGGLSRATPPRDAGVRCDYVGHLTTCGQPPSALALRHTSHFRAERGSFRPRKLQEDQDAPLMR